MSTQRHLHVHVQNLRNCVHTCTETIQVNDTGEDERSPFYNYKREHLSIYLSHD